MKKIIPQILFLILIASCQNKDTEIERNDAVLDSLILKSEEMLKLSQQMQEVTDSTAAVKIQIMGDKIKTMDLEIKKYKKGETPRLMRVNKFTEVHFDTIYVERVMTFDEVEKLYFEMKKDSQQLKPKY